MDKTAQHETMTNASAMMMTAMMQPKAIMESVDRAMQQMNDMNRAMLGSMQQSANANWDLAMRMTRCSDPSEALQVCKEWLNSRRDAVVADGRNLTSMWFKLCEIEAGSMAAASRAADESMMAAGNISTMQRPMAAGD